MSPMSPSCPLWVTRLGANAASVCFSSPQTGWCWRPRKGMWGFGGILREFECLEGGKHSFGVWVSPVPPHLACCASVSPNSSYYKQEITGFGGAPWQSRGALGTPFGEPLTLVEGTPWGGGLRGVGVCPSCRFGCKEGLSPPVEHTQGTVSVARPPPGMGTPPHAPQCQCILLSSSIM